MNEGRRNKNTTKGAISLLSKYVLYIIYTWLDRIDVTIAMSQIIAN